MIERIKQFIESQEKSVLAFEKKIGASTGVISKAITNNTDIQSKWIAKICESYPRISLEWLITGEGKMLKSTVKERFNEYLLYIGKSMDEIVEEFSDAKTLVFGIGDYSEVGDVKDFVERKTNKYPDLNAEWLLTGKGSMIIRVENPHNATVLTIPGGKKDDFDFVMRIGESNLLPKYKAGDVVACKVVMDLKK